MSEQRHWGCSASVLHPSTPARSTRSARSSDRPGQKGKERQKRDQNTCMMLMSTVEDREHIKDDRNVAISCETKSVWHGQRMRTHVTSLKLLQTYANGCKLVHTNANERMKRSEKGCLVLRQGSVSKKTWLTTKKQYLTIYPAQLDSTGTID